MTWILLAAGLVLAGLAVIGVAAARVVAAARGLNREITQINAQFSIKEDLRG
jgi:hypothetical protein